MASTQRETRRFRRREPRAEVTIHDVAARAGVSVATVSRVLNGKELVREETSRQVLEAAKDLRYVPNVAARSLSIRRSHTLGIVLPDVHGEFFSELIRGIDLAARRAGYHILVSGSHSSAAEMLEVLETMRGRVDGVVLMAPDVAPAALREPLAADLPLVVLSARDDQHDAITIDNYGGARLMMDHLLSLGHTRIAFICGPGQNSDARERVRGYRQAMRTVGARMEVAGDFTERAGFDAAQRILAADPRPTAIFAANDAMAVGVLGALAEAGVECPKEMAVVGFDDIPIARYIAPSLTTVRVDIAEIGRRAFAILFERLNASARGLPRRTECVTTTLVIRKSCGAAVRRPKISKGEK
ncbi:MAG TPA: LacI family DNA-binding transcriptional regulator [Thermoanaerobaculia bacterium]|jgi:LacI family transcriptional regulator|nr:LacI family DNA-binding transcriptional regulator [Thermoanaerobaculia bacterium]